MRVGGHHVLQRRLLPAAAPEARQLAQDGLIRQGHGARRFPALRLAPLAAHAEILGAAGGAGGPVLGPHAPAAATADQEAREQAQFAPLARGRRAARVLVQESHLHRLPGLGVNERFVLGRATVVLT